MSSNKMPGAGKSGNWRRAWRSLIVRLASSAELAAAGVESLLWAALLSRVGSGLRAGGCEDVEEAVVAVVDGSSTAEWVEEAKGGLEADMAEEREKKRKGAKEEDSDWDWDGQGGRGV
jgi:hypothetical protein